MGFLARAHVWFGTAIAGYFALLALLSIPYVQKGAIFLHWVRLPIRADFSQPEKYGLAPGQVRNLYLTTPDGASIGVWHALPDAVYERHLRNVMSQAEGPLRLDPSSITDEVFNEALRTHKTVLYSHGNAASRATGFRTAMIPGFTRSRSLEGCQGGLNFVSYDYRGFADSSPASKFPPTESGLITDAQTVWDWLIKNGSKPAQIGLIGHSLGTAVTAGLAYRLDSNRLPGPQAVGLIAPFTSLPDLLRTYVLFKVFPILQPFSFVPKFQDHMIRVTLKIHFDTRAHLSSLSSTVNSTILLIHAKDDLDIPNSHSHALFEALQVKQAAANGASMPAPIQKTLLANYGTLHSSHVYSWPRALYLEANHGGHNQVGRSETSLRSLTQLVCES